MCNARNIIVYDDELEESVYEELLSGLLEVNAIHTIVLDIDTEYIDRDDEDVRTCTSYSILDFF